MSVDTLRCRHCRDVIGVYEPMVVLLEHQPVRTSRTTVAAEQLAAEPCFHASCYAELHDDATAGDAAL